VNQICIINADGTGYAQLTRGESHSYYPAISRNGTAIVFAVNRYEMFDLYRLSLRAGQGPRSATSRLTQLTDLIGNAFSPSFSPDGRRIIFVNRLPGEASSLWMLAADGQDPRHIYSAPRDIVGAAWSADGTTAAITVEAESHFAYDVFLLDLDDLDAPPRELSIGVSAVGGSVAWSPDATDLLIFAGPAAAREIYRLDVETGATTQLTFGGNNASAAYSPDGQYIVFNSLRNGGQADLYTMRSDGHSMKRLTAHPEPDWQPQWGP
jgi:TolB protein